jgi:hypothetical protein
MFSDRPTFLSHIIPMRSKHLIKVREQLYIFFFNSKIKIVEGCRERVQIRVWELLEGWNCWCTNLIMIKRNSFKKLVLNWPKQMVITILKWKKKLEIKKYWSVSNPDNRTKKIKPRMINMMRKTHNLPNKNKARKNREQNRIILISLSTSEKQMGAPFVTNVLLFKLR